MHLKYGHFEICVALFSIEMVLFSSQDFYLYEHLFQYKFALKVSATSNRLQNNWTISVIFCSHLTISFYFLAHSIEFVLLHCFRLYSRVRCQSQIDCVQCAHAHFLFRVLTFQGNANKYHFFSLLWPYNTLNKRRETFYGDKKYNGAQNVLHLKDQKTKIERERENDALYTCPFSHWNKRNKTNINSILLPFVCFILHFLLSWLTP